MLELHHLAVLSVMTSIPLYEGGEAVSEDAM